MLTLLVQRQDGRWLLEGFQNSFQDVQGDVASWEREDEWERVGKADIVMLRLFISTAVNIFSCHVMLTAQEG